jgi:hypothetical protein
VHFVGLSVANWLSTVHGMSHVTVLLVQPARE